MSWSASIIPPSASTLKIIARRRMPRRTYVEWAAALVLTWATLEQDRLVWRGVQMDADLRLRIVEAAQAASSVSIDVSGRRFGT